MTCFNRKEKTLACLKSLEKSHHSSLSHINVEVFLTDDGCTDGTSDEINKIRYSFPIHIQRGNGQLFWNGGMIKSWEAALNVGGFDGYLWLNDDSNVLTDFWNDLSVADEISVSKYGKKGIYVGSTCDLDSGDFTYGGFNFTNKWTLKDEFVLPNGKDFQPCQCAHGNITFVSHEVVEKMGIFFDGYIHGAGDHDYSYRAYKGGFPILVMPHFAGTCENDHNVKSLGLEDMTLKQRLDYMRSPLGFNFHNTLLFQKRNFPYRLPFVWLVGYGKILFPKFFCNMYRWLRK